MTASRRALALLGSAALVAAAAAPATGGQQDLGPYERFDFSYTSKKPGKATGFRYRVALRTQGDAQPPAVRELRLTLHPGTRFDLRAITRCSATDEQIAADRLAACPPASRVATGSAGVYIGSAQPLDLNATVFGTATGIVVVLTRSDGAVIRTLRGKLAGNRRRLVVPVPELKLPSGREVALVRFELDIARAGTARRPWVRTPRRCPRGGWKTVYAPRFNTLGRVTLTDSTRCRP